MKRMVSKYVGVGDDPLASFARAETGAQGRYAIHCLLPEPTQRVDQFVREPREALFSCLALPSRKDGPFPLSFALQE